MKSVRFSIASILLFSIFFTSCSSQQDLYTTSEIISRGNWSVVYLYNGQDKTGEFEKSTLRFTLDGKLSYSTNAQNVAGIWSLIKDEKGYDLLTIIISGQTNLADLNNTWTITQRSTTDISLLSKGERTQLRIRQF